MSDQVWQLSAAVALCRLVTNLVPNAITRPVSALHGSLICYLHSTGSTVRAGNSEFLSLTVCVCETESVCVSVEVMCVCSSAELVNTRLFKETVGLCVLLLSQ